jgi:rhodanese-related sulfurtransferase
MKKLLALSLLLAACGGGSSSTETASTSTETETSGTEATAAEAFNVLTVEEVAAGIAPEASTRLAVFDANDRETYDAGHVPGATWVHYDSVTAEVLPADTSAPVVFYCGGPTCGAAPTAAETAISLGYTNVSVMRAGISGWREAGQPVETGTAAAPAPEATN